MNGKNNLKAGDEMNLAARRQSALLRLSADLAAALDENEVCLRVVNGLHDTLGYDFVALFMLDESTGDRFHAASVGFEDPPRRIPAGRGTSEGPLLDGQLHYFPDVTQESNYYYGCGGSEVDVPIPVANRVLGVLTCESRKFNAFDENDFQVLTAAAQQAGLAIEKARLLASARQRANELEALRTTITDITAELELPTLLKAIVERAARLLDAAGGELGLYDEANKEVYIVVSHNLGQDYVGIRHELGEGAMGYVAKTGEPLVIEDYTAWERRSPQYDGIQMHASMAVPLKVGVRLVGVITISSSDPNRKFRTNDLHLLGLFAQQAAIAIENARLFNETERRVEELDTLNDIGKALSSTLRIDEVLQRIYDQTRRVMHADDMLIVLYDPERHELECVFSTNQDDVAVGMRAPGDAGIAGGYIVKHRKSLLLRDNVEAHAHKLGLIPVGQLSASWLGAPMLRGDRVLGVIIVQHYTAANVFDESHKVLLETIASQAANAIENAQLYDQAQGEITERLRVEKELHKYQERLEERVDERTAELRESEERYRSLFDGIPVGLYRTTPAGQIVDANLALVEMYSYPNREELLTDDTTSLYLVPEERKRWKALMEREGVVRDFEWQVRRYDGEVIWVDDTARAVRDEQGEVLYYEGSVEDITERKRVEEELDKYREHLEELVEERTAELRESEKRYRTLFDGVPVGLYRTTPEGKVLDANLAAAQMLGYASREVALAMANTADVYVDPEERIRWKELMEQKGIVRDFEAQVWRSDGSIIWLSDTARAVKDEQGQVLYYEGSLEDISERKTFEEELRRQKDFFEALFLNSPVAVVTADLEAKVVSWNPMAEKLFGYTQEEAVGTEIDDLVANNDTVRKEAQKITHRVYEQDSVQVTTRRTHKDGSLVDVELLARPLVLAGKEVGFYAIYHDISERKKIERELRRQKDYFEALFVNSPVAVLTADLDAKVLSWNPMAEKLFGYSQEEAIGKHIDELVATDLSVREEAHTYTSQLLITDRVQATVKRTRKDGSLVDVEVLGLPVIVAGEKVGYIAIYYDISALLQARREAEAANQAKSIFLANMSHELRTPLNAILGFTQLMDRDPNLNAGQKENLGIINRSGEHLLVLINDVLEMSKIEAGQVTLNKKTFDLYVLLDSLEEMFRLRAEGKGLKLSFKLAEDVTHYIVSDEGKLRQVLSNLIGNAVKFTLEGGVALRVTAFPAELGAQRLHFEVQDSGPGIAPEELSMVFEPFVQTVSGQQSQEGTGLGLSISRQFARLMGGDITVSSEVGRGTLFEFDLVVEAARESGVRLPHSKKEPLGLAPGQLAADGRPYRILVVEDRDTNRRLLVKLLESLGFDIREAENGQEAVEAWQRWAPHLIWMDMRMPVMNGREATRRIKSMPGGDAVVIIALTATAFEEDREQILLDGCDDFVRKPYRKDEIYEKLCQHLDVRFSYPQGDLQPAAGEARQAAPKADAWDLIALDGLSTEWVVELRQATVRADLYHILDLAGQIRDQNPVLADTLVDFAENFEYNKILAIVESVGG